MKKLVSLALALITIATLFCSCGTTTRSNSQKAVIDTQGLDYHAELVIYDGDMFNHQYEIIDYSKDTVLNLPEGNTNYIGIFAQPEYNGENDETIANWAIKTDGTIVRLNTRLGIIPRERVFSFRGPKDGQMMNFVLAEDDTSYDLTIQRPSTADDILIRGVVDAWTSHHRAYWMTTGHTIYTLSWDEPDAKAEVYIKEGARCVSHHGDEAEGAIVEPMYANWSGYGWDHIYSPYGA